MTRANAPETVHELASVISWFLSLLLAKAMTLRVRWKQMGLVVMEEVEVFDWSREEMGCGFAGVV